MSLVWTNSICWSGYSSLWKQTTYSGQTNELFSSTTYSLSSKLDSLSSPLSFDGENHAQNLKTVVLPEVSFLLFVLLNIVSIYFKYFFTRIYFCNSWVANYPIVWWFVPFMICHVYCWLICSRGCFRSPMGPGPLYPNGVFWGLYQSELYRFQCFRPLFMSCHSWVSVPLGSGI